MINKQLTDYLNLKFSNLSYSRQVGRCFADKSYGFDTMFFCARFITRFKENEIFDRTKNLERAKDYIIDIFNLERNNKGVQNYIYESLNLLCFCGALSEVQEGKYQIVDQNILDIYSSNMENAYIAQYMLAYNVFNQDGIWPFFESFTNAINLEQKKEAYKRIISAISLKATNVGAWILFVTKFSTNILGYANRTNMVARTGNVKDRIISRSDIAVNVKGTRSGYGAIKKNSYLDDLSDDYILGTLEPYLVRKPSILGTITLSDGFAADLADTKMDMLDKDNSTEEGKKHIKANKYTLTLAKARTVQDEFRKSLLRVTPHKCPVCGFNFEKMLTASHIMPYAKCENTEDAMDPNNGLLMCPMCDKLFESQDGLYMTIDSFDGHIRYVDEIKNFKWLKYIQGVKIDENYLTSARKVFLKWHNEAFLKKHDREYIHDDVCSETTKHPMFYNEQKELGLAADSSNITDEVTE